MIPAQMGAWIPLNLHKTATPNPYSFRMFTHMNTASIDPLEPQTGTLTIPKPPGVGWHERLINRQTMARCEAGVFLGAALAGGLSVLGASKSGVATLGTTLASAVIVAVVLSLGNLRRRASLVMLGAAMILASFLIIRTSPWLVSLNIIMIITLSISAASYNRSGTLWGPMSTILRRVVRALFTVPTGVSEAVTAVASLFPVPTEHAPERKAATSAKRRGAIIATPLLFVMMALFTSADPVFASYVNLPTVSSGLLNNLVIIVLGAAATLGLTRLAKTQTDDPTLKTKAGPSELTIVLFGFVVLYSAFAFTQIVAAIGGATYVRERTGGSYKEYARSGFFQLLIASAITLILLFIARGPVERRTGVKIFTIRALSVMLCALSIVVVLASMQRIALYSQEFGQTMLRNYSSTFAGWLGLVFGLIALAAIVPAKRQWIAPASLILAVAGLIGMNLYNPEARVAKNNLDRALATGDLHTTYFSRLSADAVPTIAKGLGALSGDLKTTSTSQVCQFLVENPGFKKNSGVLAFNRSQKAASEATTKLCTGVRLPTYSEVLPSRAETVGR